MSRKKSNFHRENHLRKRAEGALKESEERYRTQVEAIRDVAYAVDAGGAFTYISPVVINVLGYEPDEMIGRHFLKFVHQEDQELLKKKISELVEGMVSFNEYRLIGKYGDIKWVRTLTSPILEGEGIAGSRGIIIDITERKQAEEALRRAEANFRRSLDESPLGVRIVTIAGETLYANRAILDIYGYDNIEELKTTPVNRRYTKESYDKFKTRFDRRLRGEEVHSEYEVSIIRKDGKIRHLQAFRRAVLWDGEEQFQIIYNDITDRKTMEDSLRKRDEELATESRQLKEANTAMRVLIRRREEDIEEIERSIISNIKQLVLPCLAELRKSLGNPAHINYLNIVTANLQQIMSPFLRRLTAHFTDFTPRELQIANLIKDGKSSKEIADVLMISVRTVDFHRDSIRKKLGLAHKTHSLRSFLLTIAPK